MALYPNPPTLRDPSTEALARPLQRKLDVILTWCVMHVARICQLERGL